MLCSNIFGDMSHGDGQSTTEPPQEDEGSPSSSLRLPSAATRVPWEDGEPAGDLLRVSIQAAIDVLGSAEAANICRSYLEIIETPATVRRVTVTNACVASSSSLGDVFIPAAVLVDEKVAVVGARLHVSMIQTSTGRSPYLALAAEEAQDDGWRTAASRRGRPHHQPKASAASWQRPDNSSRAADWGGGDRRSSRR